MFGKWRGKFKNEEFGGKLFVLVSIRNGRENSGTKKMVEYEFKGMKMIGKIQKKMRGKNVILNLTFLNNQGLENSVFKLSVHLYVFHNQSKILFDCLRSGPRRDPQANPCFLIPCYRRGSLNYCLFSVLTIFVFCFRYNSGGKCFSQIHTKHLTVTIDAFTIHNSLWQGKKVNLPSKKDMALVI